MTVTNPPTPAPADGHAHGDAAARHPHLDAPVPRLAVAELVPDGYRALLGVETYARRNVEHSLYELIKLRASVLNGCAFCVDMHTRDALAHGESERRLFAVAAWHESPFFTRRERAAFALTDAVTQLEPGGVSDDVWDAVRSEFTDDEIANLLIAIGMINLWNRIAVPSRTLPADA